MERRTFLTAMVSAALTAAETTAGKTLIHEHVLVDFAGADVASPDRYELDAVVRAALPKLRAVREQGFDSFVECTPAYLGRDPRLLRRLARESGLRFFTNTGWYGANNDKHLPKLAWSLTAEEIGARWIREARDGIDSTGVRPAFQKIGVDPGPLSDIDRKLIAAGCVCWKATGLRMHVHTGKGAAEDILGEMKGRGVPASAYVWVHAQNETDRAVHIRAAKAGAFVEFDGINARSAAAHARAVTDLIEAGLIAQVLISQDSGWYRVGEPGGGQFNGYTYLWDSFVPELRRRGVTDAQIRTLLVDNPARVLAPGMRNAIESGA
jgi:phosphotriesterase-related protein